MLQVSGSRRSSRAVNLLTLSLLLTATVILLRANLGLKPTAVVRSISRLSLVTIEEASAKAAAALDNGAYLEGNALEDDLVLAGTLAYDRALDAQMDKQCRFWKVEFNKWKDKFLSSGAGLKPLEALQRRSGTGDRLSGLLTAISYAMADGARLKIFWKNLDAVFQVSNEAVVNGTNLVEVTGSSGGPALSSSCRDAAYYSCKRRTHERDSCPVYNRACMTNARCRRMITFLSDTPNIAQVVGCPLKLLLAPSKELLDFKATWLVDGEEKNYTVRELDGILQGYNTISIHARLGDLAFQGTRKVSKTFKRKLIKCAETADTFSTTRDTRPEQSKWFVASDDPTLKDSFRKILPEKVVLLVHKPRHLVTLKRLKSKSVEREELLLLFAEWYLLGRSRELVTNYAHDSFGPSSFSRSSWLYNLKHEAFILEDDKVGSCTRRAFQYRGNLQSLPESCRQG